MAYFTFTFREQIFQAQFEPGNETNDRQYQVRDIPSNLEKLVEQDLYFAEKDGQVVLPGWALGDALAFGLREALAEIRSQ